MFLGNFAAAPQKQTIGQLHDVRLMHRRYAFSPGKPRILKRVVGNAYGSVPRDDFQTGHHVGHHLMLQSRIEILRILAEDHHVDVDIVEARLQARQRLHRPHIGK